MNILNSLGVRENERCSLRGARVAFLLCVALAACRPPIQKGPHATLQVAPANPFAGAPKAMLPPELETLDDVACSFHTKGIVHVTTDAGGAHEPLRLRFTAAGLPYATVFDYDEATVETRLGPRASARASIEILDSVRLNGFVDLDSIDLHAARPFVVGGLFLSQEYTRLRWESGAPGAATISIAMTHVRAPADLLRASRPCADLSAGWRQFAPQSPPRPGLGNALLAVGETRLSTTPEAPASASVIFEDHEDRLVSITERRGSRSNVVIHADQALIVGWVPSSALTPTDQQASRDYHPPSGIHGFGARASLIQVVCPSDIPLVAEVTAERRTVGTVRARTVLGIGHRAGDFSDVILTGKADALAPANGARLLVRNGDLAGCDVLPAKPDGPEGRQHPI